MSRPQVRVVAAPASSAEDVRLRRLEQLEEHIARLSNGMGQRQERALSHPATSATSKSHAATPREHSFSDVPGGFERPQRAKPALALKALPPESPRVPASDRHTLKGAQLSPPPVREKTAVTAMEHDVSTLLRDWSLCDATDVLVLNGVINMQRLKDIELEEVPDLGLPFATAKAFRRLIEHLNPTRNGENHSSQKESADSKTKNKKGTKKTMRDESDEEEEKPEQTSKKKADSDDDDSEEEEKPKTSAKKQKRKQKRERRKSKVVKMSSSDDDSDPPSSASSSSSGSEADLDKIMSKVVKELPSEIRDMIQDDEDAPPQLVEYLQRHKSKQDKSERRGAKTRGKRRTKTRRKSPTSSTSTDSGDDVMGRVGKALVKALPSELKEMMEADEDLPPEIAKLLQQYNLKSHAKKRKKTRRSNSDGPVGQWNCKKRDILRIVDDEKKAEEAFEDADADFNGWMKEYLGQTGKVVEIDDRSVKLKHEDDQECWWAYGAVFRDTQAGFKKTKKPQWEKVFARYTKFWRRIARMAAVRTQPGDLLLQIELKFFQSPTGTIETLGDAGWKVSQPIERILLQGVRDFQVILLLSSCFYRGLGTVLN